MSNTTADQRRAEIARLLAEDPSATQQQLAAQLGVGQKTISRDVEELRCRGVLVATNPSGRGRPRGSTAKSNVGAGAELVARVVADMAANGLEPDGKEEELLALASRLADRRQELEDSIACDGLSRTVGGKIVINPCVAESRQTTAAIARVLLGIQMERSTKNPVKQRAAQSRWRQHNASKAARYEADA